MQNSGMTRRSLLQAGMIGSCGVLASLPAFAADGPPAAKSAAKPSSLTITKVETFSLEHKLAKAIGVSTALSPVRDALLVKISTDSGLAGWGEAADVGGTRGIIEDHLKKVLLGANPLEHRKLWRA